MRSRAFLLEPAGLDVSDAARFGTVTRLFRHHSDHDLPTTPDFADQVIEQLRSHDYSPDADYIIITGQLVAMVAMASAIVGEYGQFKALVFYGRINEYQITLFGSQRDACQR